MGPLPYKGLPENVLPTIHSLVADLVDNPPVTAFCIGRASDLSRVKERHGCKRVFALYSTEKQTDAVLVEDDLEKALGGHRKYYGDVEYDAASEEAHACYVYLAVWTAGSERRVPAV